MKMTEEQIAEIKAEMVPSKDAAIVRFQVQGQTLNICSGELQPKGINVMHQQVYWNFTKETAKKIAGWLGAKCVFSE